MVKKVAKESDILKAARKLLEQDKENCLCNAIGKAAKRRNVVLGNRLASWVMRMLNGLSFYSTWLAAYHPAKYREAYESWQMTGRRGSLWKQGRLAWLDWMIAECQRAEAAHG